MSTAARKVAFICLGDRERMKDEPTDAEYVAAVARGLRLPIGSTPEAVLAAYQECAAVLSDITTDVLRRIRATAKR